MKIKTNNKPRPIHESEEGAYFIYKGEKYLIKEFVITDSIPGFEAGLVTSYYSCIAVKLVGTNMVKVAYVYW